MGQVLSEPITEKNTSKIVTSRFIIGVSSMQGWRTTMEDAHTVLTSVPDDEAPTASYFAVFDGHGGTRVAQYASKVLHRYIVKSEPYQTGKVKTAMEHAFLKIDEEMKADRDIYEEMSGATAVVVLIKNNILYCANVGDSRAVASLNGRVEPLSEDHKPTLPIEMERITSAGGWVEADRVNGSLALSRALGDYQFKTDKLLPPERQIVSPFPDIIIRELDRKWKFMVIACDGIWEVLENEQVIDFIKGKLNEGLEPDVICELLMDRCIAPNTENSGAGCDNMTVIIVVFRWKEPSRK